MYWTTNDRPISNIPFLSKILEKFVLHKLFLHLQENNLCNAFQSAYRTGHSTETALLHVVNHLLNATDEDRICSSLTGSFIYVWYCWSPDSFSPSRNCLWFPLYRYPVVSIIPSGQKSVYDWLLTILLPLLRLMFGVPQGSVLGSVYITLLSDSIANHSVNNQPFADDSQLQTSTPPNDVQIKPYTWPTIMCRPHKAWMCNNQLKLNDKTEAILSSTPSLSSCH